MKLQKGTMRAEGVDPARIRAGAAQTGSGFDAVYWLPPGKESYEPFEEAHWAEMCAGKVKL